jgi:hypothetical protein
VMKRHDTASTTGDWQEGEGCEASSESKKESDETRPRGPRRSRWHARMSDRSLGRPNAKLQRTQPAARVEAPPAAEEQRLRRQ